MPAGDMPRLDQGPAMELASMNEPNKVIALGTAFEVYYKVIWPVPGMTSQRVLHGVYAPWHPAVGDGEHAIDALIEVQDRCGSTRADSKINQHVRTEGLPQRFDNRCRQDGVPKAADADNEHAFR